MTEMTVAESLKQFGKEFEEAKQEFTGRARKLFTSSVKRIFDETPELRSIEWEQYTPYFNDGDECIFGVTEVIFFPDSVSEEDEDDYRWNGSGMKKTKDMEALSKFIHSQEELMQQLYGDHVRVIVQRDPKNPESVQVVTEEYEHD